MERLEALQFFEEEIRQYSLMLRGRLSPEYLKYIRKKKEIYELANKAIRETENGGIYQSENIK